MTKINSNKLKMVQVFQLKASDPNLFRSYKAERFNWSKYHRVWDSVQEVDSLDGIYKMLNIGEKPLGYKGHSLSVSDVVFIDNEGYYCDNWGWVKIYG